MQVRRARSARSPERAAHLRIRADISKLRWSLVAAARRWANFFPGAIWAKARAPKVLNSAGAGKFSSEQKRLEYGYA